MRKRLGITLIELLMTLAITAMITAALSRAFYVVIHYELNAPTQQQAYANKVRFEDRLRAILEAAYLSPTATDQTTYLIGTVGGQDPNGAPNLTAAQAQPGTAAATAATPAATDAQSAISSGNSDGIVLTVLGQRLSPVYLQATGVSLSDDGNGGNNTGPSGGSQDFEQQQASPNGQQVLSDLPTLNETYGAQGGVAEVAISGTPTGTPGQFSGDIYMRIQRPSDADYTQGGNEQVFDPNVSKLQFEFFDGLQWDGGWDTTSTGGRHLPAAIRVHYWMKSDPNAENIFVVRLPLSDLTPALPLSSVDTTTTTTTGGTGTASRPGGGGAGGTGGTGATGRSELVLPVLPGVLPTFTNLQIEPDEPAAADIPLDPKSVFAPDMLNADNSVDNTKQLATVDGLQPWQAPPGPYSFYPELDPLQPPTASTTKNPDSAVAPTRAGNDSQATDTARADGSSSKTTNAGEGHEQQASAIASKTGGAQ